MDEPTLPATRCSLAETALARQKAAQRQRADDQAAVDRDQADQAEPPAEPRPRRGPTAGRRGVQSQGVPSWPRPLTWTAVGSGQATATINEHVLVYHRTPVLWTRARAAHGRSAGLDSRPATGPAHPSPEGSGPSLGLLLLWLRGKLGYAPFTSLAEEAGQVLRCTTTDTCGGWNPWDPNYPP